MNALKDKAAVNLQDGDVVWAKMPGFPHWPAMVFHSLKTLYLHQLPLPPMLTPTQDELLVCFLDTLEYALVVRSAIVPFDWYYHKDQLRTSKKYKPKMQVAVNRALMLLRKSPTWTREEYDAIKLEDYAEDIVVEAVDTDQDDAPSKKQRLEQEYIGISNAENRNDIAVEISGDELVESGNESPWSPVLVDSPTQAKRGKRDRTSTDKSCHKIISLEELTYQVESVKKARVQSDESDYSPAPRSSKPKKKAPDSEESDNLPSPRRSKPKKKIAESEESDSLSTPRQRSTFKQAVENEDSDYELTTKKRYMVIKKPGHNRNQKRRPTKESMASKSEKLSNNVKQRLQEANTNEQRKQVSESSSKTILSSQISQSKTPEVKYKPVDLDVFLKAAPSKKTSKREPSRHGPIVVLDEAPLPERRQEQLKKKPSLVEAELIKSETVEPLMPYKSNAEKLESTNGRKKKAPVDKLKANKETRPGRPSSKDIKGKSEKTRKATKKRAEKDASSSDESDYDDDLKKVPPKPSEPKCIEKDEIPSKESNQSTPSQRKQESKKEASSATTQNDGDEETPQDTPLSMLWGDATNDYACRREFVWDDNVFTDSEDVDLDRLAALYVDEPPSRGRRNVRTVQHSQLRQSFLSGASLDPHLMVECAQYADPTVSNDKRPRQPFSVRIHPDVAFVCDLHAHMAMCEIIGYFGGKYDAEANTVFIHAAFPCRSMQIEGDDGSTDVEMDPVSELEVRQLIEKSNLEVVGWYHSHPTFAPDPSIRDIENQAAHQELFQMNSHNHPFVGLIVGTYDSKRTDPVGLFRYFHVKGERMTGKSKAPPMYFPFELTTITRKYKARAIEAVQAAKPTDELVPAHACLHRLRNEYGVNILGCVEQIVRLLEYYRTFPRRTKWAQSWQKTNKGQKLRLSLLHYVEALDIPKDKQTAFVEDIFQYLQLAWQ